MLTAEQVKAARALLSWDQIRLSGAAEIGITTLRRMESQTGRIRANSDTIWRVTKALEDAGIIFLYPDETGDEGVRLKKH